MTNTITKKYKSIEEPYCLHISNINYPVCIIGDIHGCLEELDELLVLLNYKLNFKHKIISLGDLIDRGPYSVGALQRISQYRNAGLGYQLLGNHEKKLIKKLSGHKVTENEDQRWYSNLDETTRQDIFNMCEDLPCIIRLWYDNHTFNLAHAALHESIYQDQKPVQLYSQNTCEQSIKYKVRDVALYGQTTGAIDSNGYPERLHFGCQKENQTNVYGHITHYNKTDSDYIFRNEPGTSIYLDHACVHGGYLTGMIIYPDSNYEFVSVKSHNVYMRSKVMTKLYD